MVIQEESNNVSLLSKLDSIPDDTNILINVCDARNLMVRFLIQLVAFINPRKMAECAHIAIMDFLQVLVKK